MKLHFSHHTTSDNAAIHSLFQILAEHVADWRATHDDIKNDKLSPDITTDLARHAQGQAPHTLEGRKAVALKRWKQLNPERLSYHVMFADTTLNEDGKKLVRDFICSPESQPDLLSEADIGLSQVRAGQRMTSSELDGILAD